MAKERICGIYKIENIVNKMVYIGQSVNIEKRLADHRSDLKHNRHHNTYLQHSYNKYGKENFTYTIIKTCDTFDLDYYERYYIEQYDSTNREYGFNRESGGNIKKSISEETRKKISEYNKKRFEDPNERLKNKLAQIKRYQDPEAHTSMSIAQKKRFEDPKQIEQNSRVRIKFYQSEKGKQWIEDYKDKMSKYWTDENWCRKQIQARGTKIVQLSLDMRVIQFWDSQKEIERTLNGIYRPKVSQCLSESFGTKGNGYKNFIWLEKNIYESMSQEQINEYIKKYKDFDYEFDKHQNMSKSRVKNKVVQLNFNMSFVRIWNSITAATEGTEFTKSPIRRCCNHQTQSYKGYVWMYENEYKEYLTSNELVEEAV